MGTLSTAASILIVSLSALPMFADSQCSATNDNGDQNCSISCPSGQSASCSNGEASNPPDCHCSGIPDSAKVKNGRFKLLDNSKFVSVEAKTAPPAVQNTDLISVINAQLATLPDHHLSNACHQEWTYRYAGGIGVRAFDNVCQPVNGRLTVQTPLIVSAGPTVTVGEPNWKDIPSDIFMQHTTYKNCTSVQQSQTFQHTVTLSIGDQVTKTKAVQTGSSQSVQIHAGIQVKMLDFGGSDTLTVNTQTTITDAAGESHTEQKQESVSIPLIITPTTETQLTHSFIQYSVPIPFTGTITVDGQVASNLDGVSRLSQLLPKDADRTFEFSGVVTDSTLLDMATAAKERKLTGADCTGTEGKVLVRGDAANHF